MMDMGRRRSLLVMRSNLGRTAIHELEEGH